MQVPTGRKEAISRQDNVEELNRILQKLKTEEANLREEKQNLVSVREKQRLKLQKRINSKKKIIKKLRTEITDLKIECEKLSISVRASLHLLNLEATSRKNVRKTLKNKGYSEKAIKEIWKWYDYTGNNLEIN
jgi:hypothetical protein